MERSRREVRKDQSVNLLTRRKEPWKQNAIRTNRANLPLPVSRAVAASRKTRTDRNVNANSASARSSLAEAKRVVAANKAALSKAGNHKPWINKRRETTPAVSLFPTWELISADGFTVISGSSVRDSSPSAVHISVADPLRENQNR